jgi:polysaccharide export outer membrane protein
VFVSRRLRAVRLFSALLVVLAVCAGAAQAQFSGPALDVSTSVNHPLVPTTDPAILYPAQREVLLGVGDSLTVHIYGTSDYVPTVRVALDGTIQLPLIGSVSVIGLTVHEAEDLIATRLTNAGMYRDPQVTLQLLEAPSELVTVIGEMHGVFPVVGPKRLLDVLALAGGLPSTASHLITIDRPGVAEPIIVDLGTNPTMSDKANVPVFARDTIVVSRIGVVYLLGAFRTQGAIPMQQNAPLTLMQVAALGGGVGFEGKYTDLRIVRTTGVTRSVVKVDIKKVMDGKLPDPVLQADDIVFLPTDKMKAAIKVGGLSTLIGVASVLLYTFHN